MAEEYGNNLLLNSSAESLEDWETLGVSRVPGGTEGTHCFQLLPTAFMWQELDQVDILKNPPDFKISIDFRLPTAPLGIEVLGHVLLQFGYVGETIDRFILPCHPSLLPEESVLSGGWIHTEQICPVNNSLVLRAVRISVITEDLEGGLQVDNIQLRKNLNIWEEMYEETPWVELFREKSILYGLDADRPVLR